MWSFLRGGAPEGLYQNGHNIMLYKDDVPNVEVGVEVSGPFESAADVVASVLPGGLVATAVHTGPRWEIYGDPDPSTGDFSVDVFWSLLMP
ncbi:MAG TPA: hypothetical protein VGH27_34925 [Streptosporangiaceae bacterium]